MLLIEVFFWPVLHNPSVFNYFVFQILVHTLVAIDLKCSKILSALYLFIDNNKYMKKLHLSNIGYIIDGKGRPDRLSFNCLLNCFPPTCDYSLTPTYNPRPGQHMPIPKI